MKQYLVFDAYGTLLKVNSNIQGLSKEEEELSNNIQALWRTKQLEYTWLNSLMGNFEGFNKVTNQALDYAFNFYKVENESLKQSILSIFDEPSAFDDSKAFLSSVKAQDLQTAILSNGVLDKLKESVRMAGIENEIDEILSADEVKIFKPSPKVYQIAVDRFNCSPKEVYFFSSNPWDIAGATSFGFTTIWINRKSLPFDELGVKPTFEFKSFDEFTIGDLVS